jgi:hypothetical protein
LNCGLEEAGLTGYHPQKMKCLGAIEILMENLLAEIGGLLQAARLKMLKRHRERLIRSLPVLSNWGLDLFHGARWKQATGLCDLSARSAEGSRSLSCFISVAILAVAVCNDPVFSDALQS